MAKQPKHKGKDAATTSDCAVVSFNDMDEYAILGTASTRNQNHSSRLALLEDDELVRNKIKKEVSQHLQNPSAQIRLSALRFITAVLFGVGTVVGVMYVFLKGVTIKRGVADPIGSSKHADSEVEFYQTMSGYLTAGFGMIMEKYFAISLAVMLTYFGNIKLYPSDKPHQGQSKMKRAVIFCMTPMIIYVVNIGLSSLFIQHTTSGVQRVFVKQDLVAMTLAISPPWASATTGNAGGVENTILRSAVRKRVVPFEILSNSSCQIKNTSDSSEIIATPAILPVVKEVRSTAVVFGFPVQNWNHALFPKALTPTHSIKFTVDQLNGSAASAQKSVDDQFASFQEHSGFDFLTGYEMLLQGKTLLERSISDSNSSALYPCTLVDGRSQDDQPPGQTNRRRERRQRRSGRRLQDSTETTTDDEVVDNDDETSEDSDVEDKQIDFRVFVGGENDGKRVCAGAISSLPDLANMTDKSMHNLRAFANTITKGMNTTLSQIAVEEIEITLEKFALSDQINLTALSLDVPLAADVQYRDLLDYCTPEGELKASFLENLDVGDENSELSQSDLDDLKSMFCAQAFYPYDKPNSLCGSNNCVFLDKSELGVHLKKQLLLMPYLKDCSVQNLQYNNDFFNFLPSGCKPQQHAVFLYGLGSYMSGDEFDYGGDIGSIPYLTNPRRHITLSFAKLEWKLEDVSQAFNAKCGAPSGCDGLVLKLENVTSPSSLTTQVLVLGNSSLPSNEILSKDFRNPVQLVTLNAPPFYYPQYDKYFEWEYLDKKRFSTTSWPQDNNNSNNNANKSQSMGLNGSSCSVLIDSYINQVEANHYYLEEPLQALYTSAMFYLFQDAAVKQLTIPKDKASVVNTTTTSLSFLGAVRFKGDRERKEIKFSIPLVSAVGTFAGLTVLLLFTIVVLVFPKERLKNTHEINTAARLVDVLTDDAYPPAVHTRKLVYSHESTETRGTTTRNGVDLDEYVVDTITFHHKRDPERKVYM